jgi:dTDP-4-amino-4,6-dideoxygalactose transaminase
MNIPLTAGYLGEEEQHAAAQAIQHEQLTGGGAICKSVERQLQDIFQVEYALLTTSCTHALEMAMLALDIGPGDEVILPSFTFVSTANCIVLRGATPIFADIQPDTLNIDSEDIRRRITSRTRAIIPVHYAGVGCDMDALRSIGREHGLAIVEDAAQGVDARYKGRYLGTIGDMGCYSFHSTKNIVCGEGGALLTNDSSLIEKARVIQEKGTNRSLFMRGLVDKYSWVSLGSSYVQSDVLAAILTAQLAKRDVIRQKRAAIWQRYYHALEPLAAQGRIILPYVPADCDPNYHIFFIRVASEDLRNRLLHGLREAGVGAAFHYVPLHSSPFGRSQGWAGEDLPHTEQCSRTLIRLPLFPGMGEAELRYVLDQTIHQIEALTPPAPHPHRGHQPIHMPQPRLAESRA